MSTSFDPYFEWLGIPPSEQPPDHYRLLGIERFEHDPNVVAAAADRQIAFVVGLQKGERAGLARGLVNELSAARSCLLNPAAKAEYDSALRSRLPAGATADQRVARPAPRSPAEPPAGTTGAPAAPAAPTAPYTAVPSQNAPSQGAAWPPGTYGPAAATPPSAGTVPQQPGAAVGQPPAYAVPPPPGSQMPPSAGAVPPVGGPRKPPVTQPPVSPPAAPAVNAGGPPAVSHRTSEPAADDEEDSTRNQQLWLLAAIAAVVVLGTGVTAAVIIFGLGPKPATDGDDGGRGTPAAEVVTGPLVAQQADGGLYFSANDAVIHGDTATRGIAAGREVITNWTSAGDWLSWDFRVDRPRMFRVELIYAAPASYGGTFSVAIDDMKKEAAVMKKEAAVRDTGGTDAFLPHEVGFLTVRRSGPYRFEMRVVRKPPGHLMNLRSIRLTPYDIGYVREGQ